MTCGGISTCGACGKGLATATGWSRNCTAVAALLIFAPLLLKQRYLPELPNHVFVGWVLCVWLGQLAVMAMGALQIVPRRLPFLQVAGLAGLTLAVVALFFLSLAGFQWLFG